ncbi:MAG: hypothetical protein ABW022_03180 [Actinoplanes sp.]
MTIWLDPDDDWTEPPTTGVWHTMATDDGRLLCCGAEAVSIPAGDGMTPVPANVTCGVEA